MSEDDKKRHSLAHIMAAVILKLWPNAQFGVGPTVDNGFYYDVYIENQTLSDKDLVKIEKYMKKMIASKLDFVRTELSLEQAISWAEYNHQPFKLELLKDIEHYGTTSVKDRATDSDIVDNKNTVSFYQVGDFIDLCRGPHINNTSEIGVFKLTKVAGAYWRGDEKNQQMQRIYGVAFSTQSELDDYLNMIDEAKKRDHRKLGKELDLFTFSDLVGSGLPMFTPRGTILRDKLADLSNQMRQQIGFEKVWSPHITKKDLYEKSGHWAKFGEELFLVKSQQTSDEFCLKPMNCPHHTQIYDSKPRSYKDLPVRFLETTTPYRDEKTGELGGLSRVRSLTQDDSHIFCRPDQIEQEIDNLLAAAQKLYRTFDMKLRVRLSYRDQNNSYLGDLDLWNSSQNTLRKMAEKNQIDYYEQTGEAAFYGPKIDFMASDALGREHQVATVQLDFVQPERFSLKYIDQNGQQQTPVMIHCALLGTIERFMSVFIEHTAGWFPLWVAPEQIRILTINQDILAYANQIKQSLDNLTLAKPIKHNDLRVTIDDRNQSLGKKIKEAVKDKIPIQIIVGNQDKQANQVSIRTQVSESKVNLDQLIRFIEEFNEEQLS